MKTAIQQHIDSMRSDFLGYANYKASNNHSDLTGAEILEQSVQVALNLPEDRRNEMHNTHAREKYTQLDFYIIRLIKASAERNKPPAACVKKVEKWYEFLEECKKITALS